MPAMRLFVFSDLKVMGVKISHRRGVSLSKNSGRNEVYYFVAVVNYRVAASERGLIDLS